MAKQEYFIGYTLSGDKKPTVDELRWRIADIFDVHGALMSPLHITLFSPFETGDVTLMVRHLKRLAQKSISFTVPVTKFTPFDQKVWYLNLTQYPNLSALQSQIATIMKNIVGVKDKADRHRRHFHVTLAYKDVSPEKHRLIAKFLQNEPLPIHEVLIDNVTLLSRQSDNLEWESMEVFHFKDTVTVPGTKVLTYSP